jgi:hypothetical protein
MATFREWNLSAFTAGVHYGQFHDEVAAGGITPGVNTVKLVEGTPDKVRIEFDAELPVGEESDVDDLQAAHDPSNGPPRFGESNLLVSLPIAITLDGTWQDLAHWTFNAKKQFDDLAKAYLRCVGSVKTSGTDAQFRIIHSDTTTLIATPFKPGNTAGAWTTFKFKTDVTLPNGRKTYTLQADLNGATSADIRGTEVAILRKAA